MSIDYAKAQRQFRAQKTALTKAINSGEPQNVVIATEKAVAQWEDTSWPDSWHRWQRALDDAFNAQRDAFIKGQAPRPDARSFDIETIRRRHYGLAL